MSLVAILERNRPSILGCQVCGVEPARAYAFVLFTSATSSGKVTSYGVLGTCGGCWREALRRLGGLHVAR